MFSGRKEHAWSFLGLCCGLLPMLRKESQWNISIKLPFRQVWVDLLLINHWFWRAQHCHWCCLWEDGPGKYMLAQHEPGEQASMQRSFMVFHSELASMLLSWAPFMNYLSDRESSDVVIWNKSFSTQVAFGHRVLLQQCSLYEFLKWKKKIDIFKWEVQILSFSYYDIWFSIPQRHALWP